MMRAAVLLLAPWTLPLTTASGESSSGEAQEQVPARPEDHASQGAKNRPHSSPLSTGSSAQGTDEYSGCLELLTRLRKSENAECFSMEDDEGGSSVSSNSAEDAAAPVVVGFASDNGQLLAYLDDSSGRWVLLTPEKQQLSEGTTTAAAAEQVRRAGECLKVAGCKAIVQKCGAFKKPPPLRTTPSLTHVFSLNWRSHDSWKWLQRGLCKLFKH